MQLYSALVFTVHTRQGSEHGPLIVLGSVLAQRNRPALDEARLFHVALLHLPGGQAPIARVAPTPQKGREQWEIN